jgi:exopolysaccharide biosynthesis predicted pyruvyltransferase EpsI
MGDVPGEGVDMSFESNRASMEKFLQQFAGQEILYHPNPGNGGDSLIALGTYEAFARQGIEFKLINLESDVKGKVVFLAGGGNLIPLYWDIAKAFNNFFGRAKRIVLLPHTIRGHEELLSKLDETCTIFCRDAESYIHVTKVNLRSEVYLDHDMACHLNARAILHNDKNAEKYREIVTEKLAGKELDLLVMPQVNFFRIDWESARKEQVSDMDISAEYTFGVWPENALKSTWCMLKTVSMAALVHTDRLHVGISCALMRTPCVLYDNSYGKNSGIYRHSLRNRVPFIQMREFEPEEMGLHHAAF